MADLMQLHDHLFHVLLKFHLQVSQLIKKILYFNISIQMTFEKVIKLPLYEPSRGG